MTVYKSSEHLQLIIDNIKDYQELYFHKRTDNFYRLCLDPKVIYLSENELKKLPGDYIKFEDSSSQKWIKRIYEDDKNFESSMFKLLPIYNKLPKFDKDRVDKWIENNDLIFRKINGDWVVLYF